MNVKLLTYHGPNLLIKNTGNSFSILSYVRSDNVGVVLLGLRLISCMVYSFMVCKDNGQVEIPSPCRLSMTIRLPKCLDKRVVYHHINDNLAVNTQLSCLVDIA